jgi:hypothetical protein
MAAHAEETVSIIRRRLRILIGGKVSRWILVAALVILSPALPSATLAGDVETRPAICSQLPKGWNCVATKELVEDTDLHLDLRSQVQQYKSRASRFGLTIGFGLGVGGVVDDSFDVRWVPTGGAFIVYGIRF